MKEMTFVSRSGRKYRLNRLGEMENINSGRYILEVKEDGEYKLCYGPFLIPLKFNSFAQAQEYVIRNEELVETMW